mmetsp:Transcript_64147/g.180556  ORF Transcript_64147/g.180556 Transcript_64147/m.180556 type:complete len:221 (+) Transcript_64147:1247-1909(+)
MARLGRPADGEGDAGRRARALPEGEGGEGRDQGEARRRVRQVPEHQARGDRLDPGHRGLLLLPEEHRGRRLRDVRLHAGQARELLREVGGALPVLQGCRVVLHLHGARRGRGGREDGGVQEVLGPRGGLQDPGSGRRSVRLVPPPRRSRGGRGGGPGRGRGRLRVQAAGLHQGHRPAARVCRRGLPAAHGRVRGPARGPGAPGLPRAGRDAGRGLTGAGA